MSTIPRSLVNLKAIVYGAAALLFFRWAEDRARQRGLFDVETQF